MEYKWTNVVFEARMSCRIDLISFSRAKTNLQYNPSKFPGVRYRHRKIGGSCLVFSTGRFVCSGHACEKEGRKAVRRFARVLQKFAGGQLAEIKVTTRTGLGILNVGDKTLHLPYVAHIMDGQYEPELFNACMFKKGKIHFSCFSSGKIVVAGVKTLQQLYNVVYPTMLEIKLLLS